MPRTGSTYFCHLLNSHPDVICHGELFHPFEVMTHDDVPESLKDVEARKRDPMGLVEGIYRCRRQAKAVGFKIFPNHNDQVYANLLHDRGTKKVVLRRRNLLKAYTSKLIVARTGLWTSLEGDYPEGRPVKVHVAYAAFRSYALNVRLSHRRVNRIIEQSGQPAFFIDYEDLGCERTMRRLLGFLGVRDDVALTAPLRRQNPEELAQRISNFDALRRQLAGTEWEAFVEGTERR